MLLKSRVYQKQFLYLHNADISYVNTHNTLPKHHLYNYTKYIIIIIILTLYLIYFFQAGHRYPSNYRYKLW